MEDEAPLSLVPPAANDDIFRPKRNPVNDVHHLQQRLARATEQAQRLRRELMEEKIAHVIAAKFSDAIKDPTRRKAAHMEDFQRQIFDQMMTATQARCVQEMIGYYRLAGRTTFTFQRRYTGVRLETFYGRTYREPYYLLMRRDPVHANRLTIEKHTIPHFIPMDRLEATFLPEDMESLLRVLQDFLQAFVSRREQVEDLQRSLGDQDVVTLVSECAAKDRLDIVMDGTQRLRIRLFYDNLASEYPTRAECVQLATHLGDLSVDKNHLEMAFTKYRLLEAYQWVFGTVASPVLQE